MAIEFTQYRRPFGQPVQVSIERPDDVEAMAMEVKRRGGAFEIEVLQTEEVSMTVERGEDTIAIEVVKNGPPVPKAVDRLVREAHDVLVLGKERSA